MGEQYCKFTTLDIHNAIFKQFLNALVWAKIIARHLNHIYYTLKFDTNTLPNTLIQINYYFLLKKVFLDQLHLFNCLNINSKANIQIGYFEKMFKNF